MSTAPHHPFVIGIVLVINSSRGHHFVFRYPKSIEKSPVAVVPPPLSQYTDLANSIPSLPEQFGLEPDSILPTLSATIKSSNDKSYSADINSQRTGGAKTLLEDDILGFSTQFLANILSPKPAFCDHRFQLSVDDITFLGHPTLLTPDRLSDISFPVAPYYQSRLKQYQDESDANDVETKSLEEATSDAPTNDNGSSDDAPSQRLFMNMFHLVFVVENSHDGSHAAFLDSLYHNVVTKITAALRHEQLRFEYVRHEAELILGLKDEHLTAESLDLIDKILLDSSLARLMALLYDSLTNPNPSPTSIVVNNHIHVALHLPQNQLPTLSVLPRLEGLSLDDNEEEDDESIAASERDFGSKYFPLIKPHHSIVWLEDPDNILRFLPPDATPLLVKFIQTVSPTQCFEEIQLQMDCSLSQILRMAAHLIYWQKAKLITPISTRNYYSVSPQADLANIFRLNAEFSNIFPTIDLLTFLSNLSTPKPLSALLPSKAPRENDTTRLTYLDAIAFLLARGYITALQTYVYLQVPEFIRLGLPLEEYQELCNEAGNMGLGVGFRPEDRKTVLLDWDDVGSGEKEYIRMIANLQGPVIGGLFERLAPYFNGRYSIDEIMSKENVTRREMKMLLNAFQDDLITCVYSE